jgi:hypothetical protein
VRPLIRLLVLLLTGCLLAACYEDKRPDFDIGDSSEPGDVLEVRADATDDSATEDELPPVFCADHDECPDDDVCFRAECVPLDDLPPCDEDDDCPRDFICVDRLCEED